jgi:hypothetical protein
MEMFGAEDKSMNIEKCTGRRVWLDCGFDGSKENNSS